MPELKQLQIKTKQITEKLRLVNSAELCCLDLASEVGELSKEVLELSNYGQREKIYHSDFAREIGDAFYSLISLANIYDVDLETQLFQSLKKYQTREKFRSEENTKVKLEPIVLAKNFLCLNAVAGCRNNCVYCYKHGWKIDNKFIPKNFVSEESILENLLKHKYFHPNIPLAIHNSATDPFQKGVTESTFKILDGLEKMKIKNIIGLITKEYITPEMIKKIELYKFIRPVIFVTFSFLPKKYENVVNDRRIMSMKNLSQSSLKRVLYYRPIISGINDSKEVVERVIDLGEKYFNCIVRSALKLDLNILEYMSKQGLKVSNEYDVGLNIHDSIKKMPDKTRQKVDAILSKAKIPVFKKTSCAISWLFGQADYNVQWIRPKYYCSKNCPLVQQKRCHLAKKIIPSAKRVSNLIQKLGTRAKYQIRRNFIELTSKQVFYSDVKFLRMALNFPVLININGEYLTAEEYDRKYVNVDRNEIKKIIKKKGIKTLV